MEEESYFLNVGIIRRPVKDFDGYVKTYDPEVVFASYRDQRKLRKADEHCRIEIDFEPVKDKLIFIVLYEAKHKESGQLYNRVHAAFVTQEEAIACKKAVETSSCPDVKLQKGYQPNLVKIEVTTIVE